MPLISFRAGRCERRSNTNWVDPQPGKGLITLDQSNEDGLLHFQYQDLESGSLIDDLILFPGDAAFDAVPSSSNGRAYVLKFTSSSARHFYWMQDVSNEQDTRRANRVNALIDDPEAPEVEDSIASDVAMSETADRSNASAPLTRAQPAGPSTRSNQPSEITPEQMAQLQALLAQTAQSSGHAASLTPSVSLSDILSPARLLSLLESSPSLAQSLYQYLPPESTDVPHNMETLRRVVTSPELRKSARSLDQALTTGALGPLATSLGLNEDETFGVDAYLKGVERLADAENSRGMDTD